MGMGGPAMIEGGGLGHYHPKDIGPANDLYQNGVIDLLVKDEAEAVQVAKQYLSYFQGNKEKWKAQDQTTLYSILPEDRRYAYDIKKIITTLADVDSVLELRAGLQKIWSPH